MRFTTVLTRPSLEFQAYNHIAELTRHSEIPDYTRWLVFGPWTNRNLLNGSMQMSA